MYISGRKINKLLDYLRKGLPLSDGCRLAGISKSSVYRWKYDKDRRYDAIREAISRFKGSMIENIIEKKSWQASAWILERRFKDEFSLRTELIGAKGKEIPPVMIYGRNDPLLKYVQNIIKIETQPKLETPAPVKPAPEIDPYLELSKPQNEIKANKNR